MNQGKSILLNEVANHSFLFHSLSILPYCLSANTYQKAMAGTSG